MNRAPFRRFTVEEGRWLNALKQLCHPYRLPRFQAATGPFPDDEVIAAGHLHLATSGLRLLVFDADGHRSVPVTREDGRTAGSVFDASANGGFRLRHSLATRDAWFGLARTLPLLMSEERGVRFAKKVAREAIIVDNTLAGDWLFLWQIASGLSRSSLFFEAVLPLRRRLWRASPLAALAELRPQTAASLDALLAPSSVRLLELFAPLLLRTWTEQSDWLFAYRGPAEPYVARASELAEAMESFVATLQRHGRMDLSMTIIEWLERLDARVRESSTDLRVRLTENIAHKTMRDRAATLVPFERVFDIASVLAEQALQFRQTRYGEDRYDEAQVFLQRFGDDIEARAHRLQRLASDVRGTIG